MHLYPINGACHRVGANDTAFAYRDATYGMVIQQKVSASASGAAVTEEQKQQQKMMLVLMPIMFASATPQFKNRSGHLALRSSNKRLPMSPLNNTTRLSRCASSVICFAKAFLTRNVEGRM